MPQDPRTDATPSVDQDSEARDRSLLRRLQEDDASAMDEVLELHWAALMEYVFRIVGSVDSAEDIVQEACIELWTRRHTCHTSLRSYLYRAARNMALNKRRKREVRSRLMVWVRDRLSRNPPTPEEVFDGRALESVVAEALAALPERRREVFVLVRYHGLSYREAAEVLQVAPQTVANQMSAALAALRHAFEHSGTGTRISGDDEGGEGHSVNPSESRA